jgi:hypothetical protein
MRTLFALMFVGTAWAAPVDDSYNLLPFRAHIERDGVPYSAAITLVIDIYEDTSSNNIVYQETFTNVVPVNGDFEVTLGANGSALITDVLRLYPKAVVGMTVNSEALNGRQRLLAAPFATQVANGSVELRHLSNLSCADGSAYMKNGGAWSCDDRLPQFVVGTQQPVARSTGFPFSSCGLVTTHGPCSGITMESRDESDPSSLGIPAYMIWPKGGLSTPQKLMFTGRSFWGLTGDMMSLDLNGVLRTYGAMIASTTPDLAETIDAAPEVEAEDVVCVDPGQRERVTRCSRYAHTVLGVISDGTSSFMINSRAKSVDAPLNGKPLVLAGRVPVKVSLENGPIAIGDLLAPSSQAGVAMRSTQPGPTVGIALEAFDGKGVAHVLCFVNAGEGNVAGAVRRLAAENDDLSRRLGALERRMEAQR